MCEHAGGLGQLLTLCPFLCLRPWPLCQDLKAVQKELDASKAAAAEAVTAADGVKAKQKEEKAKLTEATKREAKLEAEVGSLSLCLVAIHCPL